MDWYRKTDAGGRAGRGGPPLGQREALVFESRRWTYAELNAEVDRVARALMAPGVKIRKVELRAEARRLLG